MPVTKVTREQFEWEGRHLVHKPTNAKFAWAYPNSSDSDTVTINWGHAGDVLPNGDDFEREDIARVAKVLLNEKH